MAAVPQVGRATRVEPRLAPEATATQDLYERYSAQLLGFCFHKLGSREEAEDAVQQTFLNAFRGLQRGIVPEAEAAWLFKIAENVCLTRRRSSFRRGRVEAPGDMQALQEFVAAPQRMGTDELIQLQEALAGMPASQRKAILLREWQGLSYREIADEMELTQPAVETLIFRARRSLAEGLERAPEGKSLLARLRGGLDLATLAGGLKALLAGTGAAKAVATTAAAVTVAGAVVVAAPERRGQDAPAAALEVAAATSPASSRTRPPAAALPNTSAPPTATAEPAQAAASARPTGVRATRPVAAAAPAGVAPTDGPQAAADEPAPASVSAEPAPAPPVELQVAPAAQVAATAAPAHRRDAAAGKTLKAASRRDVDRASGRGRAKGARKDATSAPAAAAATPARVTSEQAASEQAPQDHAIAKGGKDAEPQAAGEPPRAPAVVAEPSSGAGSADARPGEKAEAKADAKGTGADPAGSKTKG